MSTSDVPAQPVRDASPHGPDAQTAGTQPDGGGWAAPGGGGWTPPGSLPPEGAPTTGATGRTESTGATGIERAPLDSAPASAVPHAPAPRAVAAPTASGPYHPAAPAPSPSPAPAPLAHRGAGGLAITTLVLGLVALVLAVLPFACFGAFPVLLAAVTCGAIAFARRTPGRTENLLGLGASALSLVLAALLSIATFQMLPTLQQGFDSAGGWDALGDEITDPTAPYVLPAPSDQRGSGDQTFRVAPADGEYSYGYVHITAQGTAPFSVIGLDADGAEIETIVDATAPYDGLLLWNTNYDAEVVSFQIQAEDDWSVTQMSTEQVPEARNGTDLRGFGDVVYYYAGEGTTATGTPDDDSSVWLWWSNGPGEGLCRPSAGAACSGELDAEYSGYLQVYADRGWTLTLGEPPVSAGAS